MLWRPKNLWFVLAAAIVAVAWGLTRWITHVDGSPAPVIAIVFDERPPFKLDRLPTTVSGMQQLGHQVPEVLLTSESHILFLVTPATYSITLRGVDPRELSCGLLRDESGGPTAFDLESKSAVLAPIAVQETGGGAFVAIPSAVRSELARTPDRRAGIACALVRPLASKPTFTERYATVQVDTGPSGGALLDVSALEDVDNLRFSGGLQLPLGGDRTRLVYGRQNIVSAEWVDVASQEDRDIILVLIGALSAIAAAMVIEVMRPAVERHNEK